MTSTAPTPTARGRAAGRPSPWWLLLYGATGLTGLILLLRLGGGAPTPEPAGLPDPGPWTGWGIPVTDYLGIMLGIATVGALLVPLLSLPTPGTELRGTTYRAILSVRFLAPAWWLVTVAELVLTYSDQFAVPPGELDPSGAWGWALLSDQGRAGLIQIGLIIVIVLARRWVLTVGESSLLLGLALAAILPPVFTGHSASAGSHDTAVVSLLVHITAVTIWLGGIIALWWHLSSSSRLRTIAARRFSLLAGWCLGLTLVSGVVNAAVRLGSIQAFATTDYGRGATVKIVLLACLVMLGARARRLVLGSRDGGDPIDPKRLTLATGLELLLLSLAAALGAGLSRTPPPVGEIYTSAAEGLLGGPLPPPPSFERLLTSFTPSGLGLAVAGIGGAAYLVGVLSLRRRGSTWPIARSLSWCAGLGLVAYATMGGLGVYSHVMFSAHMAAHMVLSMVAPIFLVLGAPVTLALRTLPGADEVGGRGPRHWLAALLRSAPARIVVHPVVTACLFVGSLYAIYFTSLFQTLMESHLGHTAMELHFLLVGFLFFEVLIGDAPLPRRLPHVARLLLLLVVVPFHAFFAIALMSSTNVIALDYYQLLDRGFSTDLLADQYLAGSMTWALGEVPVVLVLIALLAQWYRSDTQDARRHDRHADRTDDAELAAHNAALARLSDRSR